VTDDAHLHHKLSTLEQLLDMQEQIATRQTRELEALLEDREREASALAVSQAAVRASEARKDAIFQSSLDAIITIDQEGVVEEFSESATAIFGFTREEAVGRSLSELIIPEQYRAAHRAGIKRFLQTGEGPVLNTRIEITALRKNGEEFPVELAIAPARLEEGTIFTGYVRDITQAKRDAERLRQLQLLSDAALATLTLDDLLAELVPRISSILTPDTVAIMLISEDGMLELAAGAGFEDASRDLPYRLPFGVGVAGRIAQSDTPITISDVREITDISPVLRRSGVISMLGAPLRTPTGMVGVVHVGSRVPRVFTEDEIDIMGKIAARISLAIEHARSYEREQRIAQTLQMSLLPTDVGAIPSVDVAVRYVPSVDGAQVGGDWYDIIPLPGGLVGMGIGDVMGHGTAAAAIMGQIRYAIRAYAFDGDPPDVVLNRLNQLLMHDGGAEMATMLYAVYDPRTGALEYASAGHPPPLLVHPDGQRTFLNDDAVGGPPIGIVEHTKFGRARAMLEPGSTLVLYTDGVVEVRGENLDVGLQRLVDAIPEQVASAAIVVDAIAGAMLSQGSSDDAAFMVVRPTAAPDAPLRMELAAKTGSLALLRASMDGWLRRLGASDVEVFELLVAVNEAAANAVTHAYGPTENTFTVEAEEHDDEITIVVRDTGRWRLPRPSRQSRGIAVMEGFTDSMQVTPTAQGTEVILRRRLRREEAR
jgi:PAS domain S-box-containing protein